MNSNNFDEEISKWADMLHSRAKDYTNTVCAIGYGGYFALLVYSRDLVRNEDFALSVILILISMLVFLFWEVIKMILNAMIVRQITLVQVAHESRRPTVFNNFQKKVTKWNERLQLYWVYVVIIASTTALFSTYLLFKSMMIYLIWRPA